jgi:hypothetical protein
MKLHLRSLTRAAFKLVFKDKIIFVPYLIFSLIYTVLDQQLFKKHGIFNTTQNLLIIMSIFGLIELFVKFYVLIMAKSLVTIDRLNIKETLRTMFKFMPKLLVSIGLLYMPTVLLFQQIFVILQKYNLQSLLLRPDKISQFQGSLKPLLLVLGLLFVIVIFRLILEFVPTIIIVEQQNSLASITKTITFLKKNFLSVLIFLSYTLIIMYFFIILATLAVAIPNIGETVLQSILFAMANTIVYAMTLLFYQQIIIPKIVDVKV